MAGIDYSAAAVELTREMLEELGWLGEDERVRVAVIRAWAGMPWPTGHVGATTSR